MSQNEDGKAVFLDALPSRGSQLLHPARGGYTASMREEEGAEDALRLLGESPNDGAPRLHLGWGSFRNLDIVVARRSRFAILCDVSQRQLDVWSRVAALLALVTTRDRFIDRLPEVLPREPRPRFFGADLRSWLHADSKRPGSWLGCDERFAFVRELFAADRVALLCIDLRDGGGAVADLLTCCETVASAGVARPDTLYLTNLLYMLAQPRGFFGEAHLDGRVPADLSRVLGHVERLGAPFRQVITAHRLREPVDPANLRWVTECFDQREFPARLRAFREGLAHED
jgi:hypothetical protein